MPGARGDLGLATRWRDRGELGATPCPPKIRIGSLLRATFCSELQRGCLQGYGGAARLRRAARAFLAPGMSSSELWDVYTAMAVRGERTFEYHGICEHGTVAVRCRRGYGLTPAPSCR